MIRISTLARAALLLGAVLSAACSGDPEAEPEAQPAPSAEAAAQPAAAPAQPPASPRDTAEARVAERRVYVDYGRPSMRGRTIMGGLVPYGQVWRTGANAATTFVTDVDLRIGETAVPAGTYTLYTLPGESAWQLIVNRQTGQWGTEYDPAQDLARIPMQVERTTAPVEQFTITLPPRGSSALDLVLEWESTRASVPMQLVLPGAR
jgi:Protein of unknown function (DUF2911)